jgi:hypothetical protein
MNVNWIGPTLIRYGSRAQQARYLPPIVARQRCGARAFPSRAGSDLASLRTRADAGPGRRLPHQRPEDLDLLCRAGRYLLPACPHDDRKRGITILLVPMDTPGITVRQIPSIIGEGDIHEVFFDDVVVPADAMLGEEGQAWEIIARRCLWSVWAFRALHWPQGCCTARWNTQNAGQVWHDAGERARSSRRRARKPPAKSPGSTSTTLSTSAARASRRPGSQRRARGDRKCRAAGGRVRGGTPAGRACLGDALLLAHHQRGIVAGIASGAAEIQFNLIATELLQPAAGAALMEFTLTPDQAALCGAIDKLAERFALPPADFHDFALQAHELERELVDGEYFDIAAIEELGPVSAALVVERLARLPGTAEIAMLSGLCWSGRSSTSRCHDRLAWWRTVAPAALSRSAKPCW